MAAYFTLLVAFVWRKKTLQMQGQFAKESEGEGNPISPSTPPVRLVAALLLPILVLVGWVVSAEVLVKTGRKWQVRITGYDPRDLVTVATCAIASPGSSSMAATSLLPIARAMLRVVCV